MKWQQLGDTHCPVGQAASLLGDRWTLLILRELFLGARRFDEFEAAIGLSPHLLSLRLKRLVAEGILRREGTTRPLYRLTEQGRALQPVILTMAAWGNRWRVGPEPAIRHRHTACGADFTPVLCCSECGEPVGLDVEAHVDGSLQAERAGQVEAFRERRRLTARAASDR
ncbi:winged helix-turn-helix transcriptional regulator [Sandaracinobacteroides hominis]|uniref:winged helix-turn-helix transcriptional regulator n=1 Tax=Sandaracinobacteroides hominis TaxID=2780086 RepID=UPI0018F6C53B|nr:helix-turn-helix domain-containing protein [Sandaracinobacteroides hominis]